MITRSVVTTTDDGKISTTDPKGNAAIEVISEPKSPDTEILSKLIFNRKFAALDESEKHEIARTATYCIFK